MNESRERWHFRCSCGAYGDMTATLSEIDEILAMHLDGDDGGQINYWPRGRRDETRMKSRITYRGGGRP